MILDELTNYERYVGLAEGFAEAFEFLRRADLAELPDGRYDVDGERVYVIVARDQGRGRADSPLEAHRRYIDIQFCIAGNEEIGWAPTTACQPGPDGFDEAADIGFLEGSPQTWLKLRGGMFAVFFPADAHAPLAGAGPVHKAVAKVALSE